jgi:predicted lysophospholipase L1 biosynthesis ABC-type transport system permease subunit
VDPLGHRFGPPGSQDLFEIHGVVSDAKLRSLREPIQPTFFVDDLTSDRVVFYVRVKGNPEAIIGPVRKEFGGFDPLLPVSDIHTLKEEVETSIAGELLNARLAGAFALFSLTLAGLGIYGLMSLVVTQRQRELAIHLAVGAPRSSIVILVIRRFISAIAGGAIVGLGATLIVSLYIGSLLYGVAPTDSQSILLPLCVVIVLSLVGAAVPLIHAGRIEPAVALRQDL